ncbi:hypothetical protein TNCV_3519961 [Trichonephila clavipes]|nr:hypothetical protein TNCV_3519961 [Trichonephila clavipes]
MIICLYAETKAYPDIALYQKTEEMASWSISGSYLLLVQKYYYWIYLLSFYGSVEFSRGRSLNMNQLLRMKKNSCKIFLRVFFFLEKGKKKVVCFSNKNIVYATKSIWIWQLY